LQTAVEVTKELIKAATERDVYKELYHKLIDKAV
jgi:hypothetical protein